MTADDIEIEKNDYGIYRLCLFGGMDVVIVSCQTRFWAAEFTFDANFVGKTEVLVQMTG